MALQAVVCLLPWRRSLLTHDRTPDHPYPSLDGERDVSLFAEIIHRPNDVRMGTGAIVAAQYSAGFHPRIPMFHVGFEDGIVVNPIEKDEIEAVQRPRGKVVRTSSSDCRDVVAISCVVIEILPGAPIAIGSTDFAEIFSRYGILLLFPPSCRRRWCRSTGHCR